jgi:tetratricopeptide (TPR) repeat protein
VKSFTSLALGCLITLFLKASVVAQQREGHEHSYAIPEEGTGLAHMDISCSPEVVANFDRALALLHNFWYSRALEGFQQILSADPQCAMAYWGAAMTYNHPFWDAPSASDETAAWHFVQRALAAKEMSSRERLYVHAVAALFKDGGAGPKGARDEAYRDAMAIAYSRFPDDETKLFYGLAILGTIAEGTKGFERQDQAAKLFEEVYASNPSHPGVLHYLIHVYDDPEHAEQGLKAARSYAKSAAAVPHALHLPSHIAQGIVLSSNDIKSAPRVAIAAELKVGILQIIQGMENRARCRVPPLASRLTQKLARPFRLLQPTRPSIPDE